MKKKGSPFVFNKEVFSARIKKLRLKHDLKQYEVAKFIKKTRGAYGGCENGTFQPGIEMLLGIREFYQQKPKGEKISMDYLFGFSDNPEGVVLKVDQSQEIERLKEENEFLKDHIKLLKEKFKK